MDETEAVQHNQEQQTVVVEKPEKKKINWKKVTRTAIQGVATATFALGSVFGSARAEGRGPGKDDPANKDWTEQNQAGDTGKGQKDKNGPRKKGKQQGDQPSTGPTSPGDKGGDPDQMPGELPIGRKGELSNNVFLPFVLRSGDGGTVEADVQPAVTTVIKNKAEGKTEQGGFTNKGLKNQRRIQTFAGPQRSGPVNQPVYHTPQYRGPDRSSNFSSGGNQQQTKKGK